MSFRIQYANGDFWLNKMGQPFEFNSERAALMLRSTMPSEEGIVVPWKTKQVPSEPVPGSHYLEKEDEKPVVAAKKNKPRKPRPWGRYEDD
jgi:hypothetical protein